MIKGVTKRKLLELEVLTMDRAIFEQIEMPSMTTPIEEWRRRVEREAVTLLILPHPDIPDIRQVWLICQGEHRLWRWMIGDARQFADHGDETPWLLALPQVFLRGARRKK